MHDCFTKQNINECQIFHRYWLILETKFPKSRNVDETLSKQIAMCTDYKPSNYIVIKMTVMSL